MPSPPSRSQAARAELRSAASEAQKSAQTIAELQALNAALTRDISAGSELGTVAGEGASPLRQLFC